MRATSIAALLVVALAASDASAIVIRHDRQDARYRQLGQGYPAVGSFLPQGEGVLTLIAPQWAITAAHVARDISPFTRTAVFAGREYPIERLFFHPSWDGRAGYDHTDLALIRLAGPVEGIEPVVPYTGTDEVGQQVVFVGWGDTGTGQTGPTRADRQRRAATNVATGADRRWITFLFDEPPGGTDLEGISGPGDSGGPALLDRGTRVYLIGVSSANDDMGTGAGLCEYGSTEVYARISTAAGWIESTVAGRSGEGTGWGPVEKFATTGWPQTPAGNTAQAFFEAYAGGNIDGLVAFVRKHRSAAALQDRSLPERVEEWTRLREEWKKLTPHRIVQAGPLDLHVLVHSGGLGGWLGIRFKLLDDEPHQLDFIAVRPELRPR